MGSVGSGLGVGLPDIHLGTAGTVLTGTGVSGGTVPAEDVSLCITKSSSVFEGLKVKMIKTHLAVDELDVVGTLGVTVTSTVLGTSLVVGVLRGTTISVHLGEVDVAVKTAREVGHIDVESELLVDELEKLVGAVILEQVYTGADVRASHELEREAVAARGDTVRARVVSPIESAGLGASDTIRADTGVPCVSGVAVGVAGSGVDPTPVSVEYNGGGS